MTPDHGPTYSTRRLRVVIILLSLVTLPIVVGTSALIYYYLRFSTLVERRLQGERFLVPSRVYAQPLTVRPGQPFEPEELQRTLNNLKYDQRGERPQTPGEFTLESDAITLYPRQPPEGDGEPLRVVFAKGAVKEIVGLDSGRRVPALTLEPELITYLFDDTREKRRLVRYEELPDQLIKAVLAIEDRRFFSHPGLDPVRILGAAVRNLRADSFIQGGSTITQQLVKNFFLTPERTLRRKVQEALLALVLERRAGKKDILELYLNEIYLGQSGSFSINGVGEAARLYFNKDVGNLSLAESALLAGMIQSPNRYNPSRHARRAKERRDQVLHAMVEAGFVDAPLAEAAVAQPLRVESATMDAAAAPYFVDLVRAQLAQRYDPRDLTTQNLRVQTSLDLHLQALATRALEQGLEKLEKTYKRKRSGPIQGSLIALEPRTGRVVALVGGRSYGQSQYNRVTQAHRQPGSTFKPFVYLAAFEATFDDPALPPLTPATVVDDSPTVFFFEDKEYIPENYEDDYRGPVTLRRALAHSLNVATVKVAEMVGYDRVADLWSKKMAMSAHVEPYPAVALGSFEATPLEMATAYTVLATGGLRPGAHSRAACARAAAARRARRERLPRRQHDAQRAQQRHRRGLTRLGLPAGRGRQDRHDQRPARRLVRRLHARAVVRGLGGARRQHPAQPLRRARGPAHLGRVHEGRAGGRQDALVRGAFRERRLPRRRRRDRPAGRPALPQGHLGVLRGRHRTAGILHQPLRRQESRSGLPKRFDLLLGALFDAEEAHHLFHDAALNLGAPVAAPVLAAWQIREDSSVVTDAKVVVGLS